MKTHKFSVIFFYCVFLLNFAISSINVHAATYGDDEARLEIIKLRKQVDEISTRINNRFEPVSARIDSKADKKSVIDMAADLERLRTDIADLRNQIELLTNEVTRSPPREFYLKQEDDIKQLRSEFNQQNITIKKLTSIVEKNK